MARSLSSSSIAILTLMISTCAFRAALTNQLRAMDSLTFYKMLSYIYAFLLGAFQRVSLYHQLMLHCIRKAESEGTGQLIMADSTSDSDSVQESLSIREMKDGEDGADDEELDDDDDEDGSEEEESEGFSLGTNTPDSTPLQTVAGSKRFAAVNGSRNGSPRTPFSEGFRSPPIHQGFAALQLDDGAGGHLSESAVTQLFRQLETESEEILFAVADLAHSRCAKLMGMRSEQTAKLIPTEVFKLLTLTWSFLLQSELLSGYMCHGLRAATTQQVIDKKQYLNATIESNG